MRKISVLAGVLALALTALAPTARADVVNVKDLIGEPAEGLTIEVPHIAFQFTAFTNLWHECGPMSLSTTVTENQADPMRAQIDSGLISGLSFVPEERCNGNGNGNTGDTDYEPISSGEITLNPDGSGELAIELTQNYTGPLYTYTCTYAGSMPLQWYGSGELFMSEADLAPVGGVCLPGDLRLREGVPLFARDTLYGEPITEIAVE